MMRRMSDLIISTLTERPELLDRIYDVAEEWPAFMDHDRVANALFYQVAKLFPAYTIVATAEDGTLVGRGRSVPFALDQPGRGTLPDGGWDQVMLWAFRDLQAGVAPDAASALDITISTPYTGRGLSKEILAAMRQAVRAQGLTTLVAPVRPNRKHLAPEMPMDQYVAQTRDDGLPVDPWLRTHVRAGGVIERVAPTSMTMVGSLDEWRAWTGLPFDRDGDVQVPQALVPVHCALDHHYAIYVEPNVWVRHDLS
jgi:hypothetical protein